jgi:hypothetical protein
MRRADLGRAARQGRVERDRRQRSLQQRLENLDGTGDREAVDTLRDVQHLGQIGRRHAGLALAPDRADLRRRAPDQEGDQGRRRRAGSPAAACLGDLVVLARLPAKPRQVELTELLGGRTFGGRDRIVGRRLDDDPIALILDCDGGGAPAMPDRCGDRDLAPLEIFMRFFMKSIMESDWDSAHNRHGYDTPPVLCWNGGDPSTYRLQSSPGTRPGGAVRSRPLAQPRADALASMLDVDLDAGICHACLSFVSFALDEGDPVEIARQIRCMTPDLWEDGLAESALAAVRRACELGVPDAEAALEDLERKRGRSSVARSIVRRLAEELSRRTRTEMSLEALARDRLRSAPPELN